MSQREAINGKKTRAWGGERRWEKGQMRLFLRDDDGGGGGDGGGWGSRWKTTREESQELGSTSSSASFFKEKIFKQRNFGSDFRDLRSPAFPSRGGNRGSERKQSCGDYLWWHRVRYFLGLLFRCKPTTK